MLCTPFDACVHMLLVYALAAGACVCALHAGSAPVFRLAAHDAATCALSFSTAVPGLLATCSTDKRVKLWDVRDDQPAMIASQDLQVGGWLGGWALVANACGGCPGGAEDRCIASNFVFPSHCAESWCRKLLPYP
eukprot:111758-Chlamydomonas_euryale.AAC.9